MGPMDNPIQYAVVREDPQLERDIVERLRPAHALLVASGGCTAFTLATLFPELKLTLVDPNPAQLQLVQRKAQALQRMAMDPAVVNIGSEDPQGLNACGNVETLFRCLRDFWRAFIIKPNDLEHMFDSEKRLRAATDTLTSHRYWPVSFDLFFHDEMLSTMFGPEAVQHGHKNSYPAYFRQVIEQGLKRPDALDNPFLHHIMLGHYLTRREAWPLYLQRPPRDFQAEMIQGPIDAVPSFNPFGMVQLSNIFDWMDESQVAATAKRLQEEMLPGSVILWRQLNNDRDFARHFPKFRFDKAWGEELMGKERSLFYTSVTVGVRE